MKVKVYREKSIKCGKTKEYKGVYCISWNKTTLVYSRVAFGLFEGSVRWLGKCTTIKPEDWEGDPLEPGEGPVEMNLIAKRVETRKGADSG